MTSFEGDLIRPLGLVTLYAAYAEAELDELIESISIAEPYDDSKRQWTVGKKLKYAARIARAFKPNDLAEIVLEMKRGGYLFEQRNSLIHGRIFSGGRLVSNRKNRQVQVVSPKTITALAEELFSWKERLWLHRCKDVIPYQEKGN